MSVAGELQAVTFGLGAETFAVPVTLVREILDWTETFHIPNGPDYLLGLTDLRGEGVTTIDLRRRLGLPPVAPTPSTRILVIDVPVDGRNLVLGLVVDRVLEVSTFDRGQIGAAPDIGVRYRRPLAVALYCGGGQADRGFRRAGRCRADLLQRRGQRPARQRRMTGSRRDP